MESMMVVIFTKMSSLELYLLFSTDVNPFGHQVKLFQKYLTHVNSVHQLEVHENI